MKRLIGLFIVCFLLTIIALPISAQNDSLYSATDCWFNNISGYQIDCGYVIVPEDHANPNGITIQLAVAVIRSHNSNKAPDPILYLAGGPGHAFVRQAPQMPAQFGISSILLNRDVILVDQRGMGLSQPNLICNPFENASEIFASPLIIAVLVQRMTQCPSEFDDAGINWRAYTNENNAADLAMIPQALGYDEYNIYGTSYGTMLGQIILRDYPESIRSAVLDSVASLDSNLFESSPATFENSFSVMEAHCEADFVCRSAYPNIRQTFYETYYHLKENPTTLRISGFDVPITAQLFARYVHLQLQVRGSVQTVPGLVTAFAVEDYDVVIPYVRPMLETPVENFPNQALFMTMACPQSAPYTNPDAIAEAHSAVDEPFRDAGLGLTNFLQCQLWPEIPVQSQALPVSDIPTLLLAGEYDPLTPPEMAYRVVTNLSNVTLVEMPYTGHVVASSSCGQQILIAFLDEPSQTPDSSCINDIAAPSFILHTTVTRPPIQVALAILSLIALIGLGQMLFSGIIGFRRVAWRSAFRRMGFMPLIAATVLYFLLAINAEILPSEFVSIGVLQSLMPLLIALQASAVFSAGDEPSLEIQLATPRALSWLVIERLLATFIIYGFIATGGIALSLWQDPSQDFVMLTFSWIAPALFLSGLGLFITIRSRNIALGVMAIGFLWFIFALFSEFLLPGKSFAAPMNLIQPFLWPIHVHASLDDLTILDYWINRLFMSATGIALIMHAIFGLRDTEAVLLNARRQRRQKKAATPSTLHTLKPHLTLQAVTIRVRQVAQIFGIAKYEFIMRWRTRGMKVFILTPLAVFGIFMFAMSNDSSGLMPTNASEGLMPAIQLALIRGEFLAVFASTIFFVPAIYLYPVLVADAIPSDERTRINEILGALPMSDAVYLIGKVLGVAFAGLFSQLISMTIVGIAYHFQVGAYNSLPYLDLILGMSIGLLSLTAFAVLIGASQKTARRAIGLVIALLIVPEFLQSLSIIKWILPSRVKFLLIYINSGIDAAMSNLPTEHKLIVSGSEFLELMLFSLMQIVIIGALVIFWRRYHKQS